MEDIRRKKILDVIQKQKLRRTALSCKRIAPEIQSSQQHRSLIDRTIV